MRIIQISVAIALLSTLANVGMGAEKSLKLKSDYKLLIERIEAAYNKADFALAQKILNDFERAGGRIPEGGEDSASCDPSSEFQQWKTVLKCMTKAQWSEKSWATKDEAKAAIAAALKSGKLLDLGQYISCEARRFTNGEYYCEFDDLLGIASKYELTALQAKVNKSSEDLSNAVWQSVPNQKTVTNDMLLLRITRFQNENQTERRDWVISIGKDPSGRFVISGIAL